MNDISLNAADRDFRDAGWINREALQVEELQFDLVVDVKTHLGDLVGRYSDISVWLEEILAPAPKFHFR